jgi:hypothetical protein
MQDIIDAGTGLFACFQVTDITLDESKPPPTLSADQGPHFIEVVLKTGGEIIEADNLLFEAQQYLKQIGTDEPGDAGNQPGAGRGFELAV